MLNLRKISYLMNYTITTELSKRDILSALIRACTYTDCIHTHQHTHYMETYIQTYIHGGNSITYILIGYP